MRRTAVSTLILLSLSLAAQAGEKMKAADIKSDIIGRRIYLATPLGGELPLYFHTSGKVDGSGDAIGLGKFFRPSDTGKWTIEGDRLCQQFTTWYNGDKQCFDLERTSPTAVFWRQNNGQSGVARIGN